MYGRSFGVTPAATTIQRKRATTGSVAGGGTALVTVTWDEPFDDATYTAVASIVQADAVANLRVVKIQSQTAAAIVVRVENVAAITAYTGTVHAVAVA